MILKNISLNSFRGKVYGQSLNPHSHRIRTTIEILGRDGLVPGEVWGNDKNKVKLQRVSDWTLNFLGMDRKVHFDQGGGIELDDSLPPDSLPH